MRPHLYWQLGHRRILAELERPYICRNGPAVGRRDQITVCWHGAIAIAHDRKQMANGRLTQTGNMERRRARIPTAHNHAVARANAVMARRTYDVVTFLATRQQVVC